MTLAAIVGLSRWAGLGGAGADDEIKQQIRLCTGALKGMGVVWPSAGKAMGQVRGVAGEVFEARRLAVGEREFWGRFLEEEGLGLEERGW